MTIIKELTKHFKSDWVAELEIECTHPSEVDKIVFECKYVFSTPLSFSRKEAIGVVTKDVSSFLSKRGATITNILFISLVKESDN